MSGLRRRAGWLLLAGLLLSSCFLRSNWLRVHDHGAFPFDLHQPRKALWVESTWSGEGRGFLILVDDPDADCADVLELFGGYDWYYGGGLLSESSGMLGYFGWYHYDDEDAGFEGTYVASGYAYSDQGDLERFFLPLFFGDGQLWYSYGGVSGAAEISSADDDQVVGRIRTDLVDAGFHAENCGSTDGYDSYGDYDDELESVSDRKVAP